MKHRAMKCTALAALSLAASGSLVFLSAAPAPVPGIQSSVRSGNLWTALFDEDLAFIGRTLNDKYIYAVYPGGADWRARVTAATEQARHDAPKVTDVYGYVALLNRFIGLFQDPHLGIRLKFTPATYEWPQFLVRYRGDRYLVVASETPGVAPGAAVSSCDGVAIDSLIERIARIEGLIAGVESAKAGAAERLFIDAKSPLRERPVRCRLGDKDVALAWTPISSDQLAVKSVGYNPLREQRVGISDFGTNGAWVRIGVFQPNRAQAAQFRELIARASSLRAKDTVVFDVRGNGGGPYNWFMAVLSAFYGPAYTEYYARARLAITPVFVSRPADSLPGQNKDKPDPLNTPPDAALNATYASGFKELTSPSGKVVYVMPRTEPPRAREVPQNLVRAKVYVLTDCGCGSACISFVDELLRFPGVEQVGVETYVDRRSGSPESFPLPSGNGVLLVPSMVREGRERGENVPRIPAQRFLGDIADTEAVQRWVAGLAAHDTR